MADKDLENELLEECKRLIIGVEDGWIKVDKETWKEYLKAKERRQA